MLIYSYLILLIIIILNALGTTATGLNRPVSKPEYNPEQQTKTNLEQEMRLVVLLHF